MTFLEKYGIPKPKENYIPKTTYECNLCKDTGWVTRYDKDNKPVIKSYDKFGIEWEQEKPCKCQATKVKQKKLEETGLKGRFEKNNINNFIVDSTGTKKAVETFKNFTGNYEMNTLIITGATGTGKTHLALSAINEIMKEDKSFPKIIGFGDLINELKRSMRFNEDLSEAEVLKKYREAKILLVDDLFKLSTENQSIRWIFDIINYRYNERETKKLTTIITSEHSLGDIYRIDGALGGRLIEMARTNVIELNEKNRRINF